MNKKLYIGNLPYSATEEDLRQAFTAFGTPESIRIIMDKFSGRSKGFGFVEMATEEDAQKAIDGMNGKDIGGRNILVNEARPEQPRSERSFGGGMGRGGDGNERRGRRDFGNGGYREPNKRWGRGGSGGGGNDNFGNR